MDVPYQHFLPLHGAKRFMPLFLKNPNVESILTKENVIPIVEAGLKFNERDLADKCLLLIDQHSEFVITSEEMQGVKLETLLEIFKRDSLDVREDVLLDLAMKWAETQCERENLEPSVENKRKLLGLAFFEIRFTLLPPEKLSEIVHSGLLTQEESLEMFLQYHEFGSRKFEENGLEGTGQRVVFKSNHRLFGLKKMADPTGESRIGVRTVGRKLESEVLTRLLRRRRSGVEEFNVEVEADLFMIGFGDDVNEDGIRASVKLCGTDVKVIKLGGEHGAFNVRFSFNPYRFNVADFLRPTTFNFSENSDIFICPWAKRKQYADFAD